VAEDDERCTAVGTQIDALRHEVDDRVAVLSASLLRMAIAFGLLVVAALLLSLTLAALLVAVGLPPLARAGAIDE
jgi:hypothetical protein